MNNANKDEKILKNIKSLFQQPLNDKKFLKRQLKLADLYDALSFSRTYEPHELFPKLDSSFEMSEKSIQALAKIEAEAKINWSADGSGTGELYFSCLKAQEDELGIQFPREYKYPDNMNSEEFQKSFNSSGMNKTLSSATGAMAVYALVDKYQQACSYKLFLEKNRKTNEALINKTYDDFWNANKNIKGHDYLRNIEGFTKKREFLMGVASEIPLPDVEAYLKSTFDGDKKVAAELRQSDDRFFSIFQKKHSLYDDKWDIG